GPGQEGYLWGKAAVATTALIVKAYIAALGWEFKPGSVLALDAMPMHTYRMPDDDTEIAGTTELRFTNNTSQKDTKRGLMPWLAVRGRDSIELVGFQSIAEPTKNLSGKWEQAEKPKDDAGKTADDPKSESSEGSSSSGNQSLDSVSEDDIWRPNDPEP